MKRCLQLELNDNLIGSDAIVFVEGDCDVKCFEQFALTLGLRCRISILDTEGWTNMKYYPDARIAIASRIPIYCIFDGDVSSKNEFPSVRATLTNMLEQSEDKIMILSDESIEAYLLDSFAIKKAFPDLKLSESEIQEYFQKTAQKKNKKQVLDFLLKNYAGANYGPEAAGRIASFIAAERISEEITKLLRKIRDDVTR